MKTKLLKIQKKLSGRFGPRNWWPAETDLEVCIGAILTQNTSWKNVEKAISALRIENLLSIDALAAIEDRKLAVLIKPAGYYNLKTKRLKSLVHYLSSINGGDWRQFLRKSPLEKARDSLLSVYGVGPETADSILLYAANRRAFVIDKYTIRFGARFGLFRDDIGYEGARAFFMEHLPKSWKLYNEYHALIVALGATHCKARPDCVPCPLLDDCPTGIRNVPANPVRSGKKKKGVRQ